MELPEFSDCKLTPLDWDILEGLQIVLTVSDTLTVYLWTRIDLRTTESSQVPTKHVIRVHPSIVAGNLQL